ncbi:hypothetical protein BHM03_00020702 [Ensete ventricosum]|nr:hypothetical protein BHM03_00020702 [Ensete ventricosum]
MQTSSPAQNVKGVLSRTEEGSQICSPIVKGVLSRTEEGSQICSPIAEETHNYPQNPSQNYPVPRFPFTFKTLAWHPKTHAPLPPIEITNKKGLIRKPEQCRQAHPESFSRYLAQEALLTTVSPQTRPPMEHLLATVGVGVSRLFRLAAV